MTTLARVEPVRKQIVIEASQAHVFKTFSEGVDRWWPREHHIGTSPLKRAVIEGRAGGRWYSICEDGTEIETGKVLTWEPPRRLVLAWQINGEWKYDPNFITEVEVIFTAEGPKKTRVDLEHRGLAHYGVAAEQMRTMLDSPDGWGRTLTAFAKAALA
jgi:uncharacterized protein YndB with AHSA1/START domain